jgi:penicillin-binding protein 2
MDSAASRDRRGVGLRLAVVQYTVCCAFAVLAVCFWYLQVAQHAKFQELAENNHQRTLALRAPRGVLFDRHGEILVENRHSFNISLIREQTRDLSRTLQMLSAITGQDQADLRAIVERNRNEPRYRPIVLVQDATMGQVAAVRARKRELPDIVVELVPTRHYRTEQIAAHLFGYVGEVTGAQLGRKGYEGITRGAIVGQSGIEQTYNRWLMGADGARRVVVNSVGREIVSLEEIDAIEGRRVMLTIDHDVQRAAEEAFTTSGFWGAAAVFDPRTGEVLSLVSLPAYDPNAFAVRIDRATWRSLNVDRLKPLQNRVIQGRYSPGSTFKVVVAVAALEEGVAKPETRVHCSGGATFYGRYFRCHKRGGHGSVDMRQALALSCNVYFYTLGNLLRIDAIHKWATALGLGLKSGIDLPHEVEGIMPSTEWKRARTGERWYPGETISVAIGQGQVSVTPISQAVMMMTVANGGTRFVPQLVKAVSDGDAWQMIPRPPAASDVRLKPGTVAAVHEGLWMAVNGAGTAGRARIAGRDVAGKTGTAQVISLQGRAAAGRTERDLRDHGWFVFFAPRDNPEIAGVVFAEHSEGGGRAAPIAKHIMETYFAKRDGLPLPEFTAPGVPPAPTTVAQRVVETRDLPVEGQPAVHED